MLYYVSTLRGMNEGLMGDTIWGGGGGFLEHGNQCGRQRGSELE